MDLNKYNKIVEELSLTNTTLIAVSKTKPVADLLALYNAGQRDFGENYVQELLQKKEELPKDIRWHFIGHLQTNKVKSIIPFVYLIHGVDSLKLLNEIDKQAEKSGRVVKVLLQVFIAKEETKYGLDEAELSLLLHEDLNKLRNVSICGLMGMASATADQQLIAEEFKRLRSLFDQYRNALPQNSQFNILSMGMSGDYTIAVDQGSNMVRIGSLIFGERQKA